MTFRVRSRWICIRSSSTGSILALLTGVLCTLAGSAMAQRTTDPVALRSLSQQFRARLLSRRTPLYERLLHSTDPAVQALDRNPDIQLMYIRDTGVPAYYLLDNLNAAKTVRTWDVWPGGVGRRLLQPDGVHHAVGGAGHGKVATPFPTPVTVSFYEAAGTTRGPLIATATTSHPGK